MAQEARDADEEGGEAVGVVGGGVGRVGGVGEGRGVGVDGGVRGWV